MNTNRRHPREDPRRPPSAPRPAKPYTSPKLTKYGSVASLTRGTYSHGHDGQNNAGGNHP